MRLRTTALPAFLVTVKPTRGGSVVAAVQHFQQEKPPAPLFTAPDGQELAALAKPPELVAGGPAGVRQRSRLPLRRTAACGHGCGERRRRRGHPWWPCGHGSRAGACGRVWRVDRCASFILIPRRAALLDSVAVNRSCAGLVLAQQQLRRTFSPSVSGLIESSFCRSQSRPRPALLPAASSSQDGEQVALPVMSGEAAAGTPSACGSPPDGSVRALRG